MVSQIGQNSPAQPVVTFVVIITFGIILAVGVNNNEDYRLPIILFSFILGFSIAVLELRTVIRMSRQSVISNGPKLSRDEQVARYVADLFEDDIPFDEIKKIED